MFIYQTPPQDFWYGMIPLEKILEEKTDDYETQKIDLIKFLMKAARQTAISKGCDWEGDIRGNDIYLFGMPDPDNCRSIWGIAWKQDNNGTTFICSPVELPWLSGDYLIFKQ